VLLGRAAKKLRAATRAELVRRFETLTTDDAKGET
jgi:hypothetical protein